MLKTVGRTGYKTEGRRAGSDLGELDILDELPCCLVVSRSVVSDFANPWTAACQASLFITISQRLLSLMCIESVMPLNHLIFCHPLVLLPSIFPSITVFSNESALHIRRLKFWSFSISPSSEYSGLISFRIG